MSQSSTESPAARPLVSKKATPLRGQMRVPGDKSISHRALMLGALAVGRTRITGLLEGEDVLSTASAMGAFGATVNREETSDGFVWLVDGVGLGALKEPADLIDMGNAGTGVRLVMGMVATHPITVTFSGDASLRKRPMGRVIDPLSKFGATFTGAEGQRLPMTMTGAREPVPITYRVPVPSAQVKSALLLAALNAPGNTTVIEPVPTRDHTERMFLHFGVNLRIDPLANGETAIVIEGQPELSGRDITVPADPSSAAFPLVAALLVPESRVLLPGIGLNPQRIGLIETLKEMGADIRLLNERSETGEPVADLEVRASVLHGIDVPAARAPSMIDEYPILAVAAACAGGTTRMFGLGELRVKESDRLSGMASGLAACGVDVEVDGDTLIVHGSGQPPKGGAEVPVMLDHRIGMAFLVLGMVSLEPVSIDDSRPMDTSFPAFADLMNGLGAHIGAKP